jgi:hypothetical protein
MTNVHLLTVSMLLQDSAWLSTVSATVRKPGTVEIEVGRS